MQDLATTSTFARLTDKSESTIRSWARRGVITPVARTVSGVALYDVADAERVRKLSRRPFGHGDTDLGGGTR